MSLKTWSENGWLTPHQSSPQEARHLLGVADRSLADAAVPAVSADGRLAHAYGAALQLAALALAAEGYRPERARAHERTIQSLRFTVGLEPGLVDTLDRVRRKRNVIQYEQAGMTSDAEAAEVLELATGLRTRVIEWLRHAHPGLLPPSAL